jgi:hypothetical protein
MLNQNPTAPGKPSRVMHSETWYKSEIAQQVPAVRHPDCLRRALAYPIGVGASTVTRDDFYPGMLTKPFRQRLSLTVRQ